jgi:alpha-galactosidase
MTLSLVDINEQTLERMYRFAGILKEYYGASAKLEATTNRRDVLSGADYVITSVARKRNEFWEQDFFMPYAYGFRHRKPKASVSEANIFGECGGPGAAFHALRSFHLTIPICRDMEELCPNALLLNFTNPESRVCMAVNKLTQIRSVGLCQETPSAGISY